MRVDLSIEVAQRRLHRGKDDIEPDIHQVDAGQRDHQAAVNHHAGVQHVVQYLEQRESRCRRRWSASGSIAGSVDIFPHKRIRRPRPAAVDAASVLPTAGSISSGRTPASCAPCGGSETSRATPVRAVPRWLFLRDWLRPPASSSVAINSATSSSSLPDARGCSSSALRFR